MTKLNPKESKAPSKPQGQIGQQTWPVYTKAFIEALTRKVPITFGRREK